MNTKPEGGRKTKAAGSTGARSSRSGAGQRVRHLSVQSIQHDQYMISHMGYGVGEQQLAQQLRKAGGIDLLRTIPARGSFCPAVAVIRAAPERIGHLYRLGSGDFMIEPDHVLRPASPAPLPSRSRPPVASAIGPGFTAGIEVHGEHDEPVPEAEVQLAGQEWTAAGLTDADGRVTLTLYGELPDTVTHLYVKPRAGYWGLWIRQPKLTEDAAYTVPLRRLGKTGGMGWGGRAMQLDQLPAEWRAAGVKIALIDSGVSNGHGAMAPIDHGFDPASEKAGSWRVDPSGHGTLCAGIIAAVPSSAEGIRGYAPDSELHVCKLGSVARCSDLVATLDYCADANIDLACLGFGCEQGSAIVENRIAHAKQLGMGLIAAAGSNGGAVQYPARSRDALAVGAVGQIGTFPEDSPHAAHASTAVFAGGFFIPAFSCNGPEIDLCAPGIGVISCQSPDGYAAADGTSLAAPHVAALASLLLAHHPDFKGSFAKRDARRVERLFQILKESARPLGYPAQTGAGLPDAARAFGLQSRPMPWVAPFAPGLDDLRNAIHGLSLANWDGPEITGGASIPPMQTDLETRLHNLKAAMQLAGLSSA
jgi:subtilisin